MGQLESILSLVTILSDDGKGVEEDDSPCNMGPVTCGLRW